jgi:PadR family transcriptional regulator PadR
MRRTDPLIRVLAAFQAEGPHYGYRLAQKARVRGGALYPMLARLNAAGWIVDRWEEQPVGRAARRYWTVTDSGRVEMEKMLGREQT